MRIPKKNQDLRRYVLRRALLQWGLFFSWSVLWIGSYLFYQAEQDISLIDALKPFGFWLFASVLIVAGAILVQLHRRLCDRSFCGVVECVDTVHSYTTAYAPALREALHYDFRNLTVLRVRLKNGKRRRIRFEQRDEFYTYYYPGTEIIHLRGLPYPLRQAGEEGCHGRLCVACGRFEKEGGSHCPICGYSLISPSDLSVQ